MLVPLRRLSAPALEVTVLSRIIIAFTAHFPGRRLNKAP